MEKKSYTGWGGGFHAFFAGIRFIGKHSLWSYLFFPGLLSIAVLLALGVASFFMVDHFLFQPLQQKFLPESWLVTSTFHIVSFLLHAVLYLLSAIVALIFYGPASAFLVIPFLGPLLEKTEKILLGSSIEISLGKDIKNAFLGAWLGLKFAFWELFIFILTLITGPLQPLIMLMVSSYFLGRGTIDVVLEKHASGIADRKERARNFYPQFHSLGIAQWLFLFIPIIGQILSPAASLVGAALIYYGNAGEGKGERE